MKIKRGEKTTNQTVITTFTYNTQLFRNLEELCAAENNNSIFYAVMGKFILFSIQINTIHSKYLNFINQSNNAKYMNFLYPAIFI